MAIVIGRAPGGGFTEIGSNGSYVSTAHDTKSRPMTYADNSSLPGNSSGSAAASAAAELSPAQVSAIEDTASNVVGALGMDSQYSDLLRSFFDYNDQSSARSQSFASDLLSSFMDFNEQNSARSQDFAREQMNFQRESDILAQNWSAQEADKTRKWQEDMSNTAHVREVADLVKAGLNPVLSVNGGAPAYSASATGQAFDSNGAMGQSSMENPLGTFLGFFQTLINSGLTMASLANQRDITAMNNETSLANALTNLKGTQLLANAGIQEAQIHSAATKYGYDKEFESAALNRDSNKLINSINTMLERYKFDNVSGNTKYSSDSSKSASEYHTDFGSMPGLMYSLSEAIAGLAADDWTGSIFRREFNNH